MHIFYDCINVVDLKYDWHFIFNKIEFLRKENVINVESEKVRLMTKLLFSSK